MSRLADEFWSGSPGYPKPYVRHSVTSREASQSISDKRLTDLHRRVWKHLHDCGGCTDEEAIRALELNPSTYRPRRIELQVAGWVRDSGRKKPTQSGRSAIVWEAIK